jgi:hypothetical protein
MVSGWLVMPELKVEDWPLLAMVHDWRATFRARHSYPPSCSSLGSFGTSGMLEFFKSVSSLPEVTFCKLKQEETLRGFAREKDLGFLMPRE